MLRLIAASQGVEPHLLVESGRQTTVKTRYVAATQQMLRADRESIAPLGGYALTIPANIAAERIEPVWIALRALTSANTTKLYLANGSLASPRFSLSRDPEIRALSRGMQSFQISAANQFIDGLAHLSAFTVAKPADARGQALKLYAIPRQPQPAIQCLIVRK